MAVITISREFGSGGDEIAQIICRDTGYRMFNKDLIAKAAQEAGLSEGGAIIFTEGEYHVSSFMERLLGRQVPMAEVRVWREDSVGARTVETKTLGEDQFVNLVEKAIESAYRLDNFVIVGRAGQVILGDLPGVLHVRVVASFEERLLRVRSSPQFSGGELHQVGIFSSPVEARRAAQDLIESHDAVSKDYLKRYYGVDWGNQMLYDLLLNTTRLDLKVAAKTVVMAAKQLSEILQPA